MNKLWTAIFAAASLTACGSTGSHTTRSRPKAEAVREQRLAGGFTPQRPLGEKDAELFRQATSQLSDVRYTPVSVATQVVAGINYRFICEAETVTEQPEHFRAEIVVFVPLPGRDDACISRIKRL